MRISILQGKLFFHKNSKIEEKEDDTNFVFLSQSRIKIMRFMKTYLHRPIEILSYPWKD